MLKIVRRVFLLRLDRVHVKPEASFIAEDPWNQNHPASFIVESYMMVSEIGTEQAGGYRYGIRSGINGAVRMMPDSLSELWRTNRVPIETLPRLLQQMKPALIRSDYRPMLENIVAYSVLAWVTGPCSACLP